MRKKHRSAFRITASFSAGIIAVLVLNPGCSQKNEIPDKPVVITSVFPVCDLIREVGGDRIAAGFIVPAGANPHNYEMLPTQAKLTSQAACFIGVHPDFDGWIRNTLRSDAKIFFLNRLEASDTSLYSEDPHIWMSVRNTKIIVSRIAEILALVDPAGETVFKSNADHYRNRLDSLDTALTGLFSSVRSRTFIQWHPAWDRLASDYGLTIAGTVESGHGVEVTARELQRLIQEARRQHVRLLVMGLNQHENTAKVLVDAIGGTLIRLDTLGDPENHVENSYIRLMANNAEKLAEALDQS